MNWIIFFAGMGAVPIAILLIAGLGWVALQLKPDYKTPVMPETEAIADLKKQNERLQQWCAHLGGKTNKDALRSTFWEGKYRIVKAENNALRKKVAAKPEASP